MSEVVSHLDHLDVWSEALQTGSVENVVPMLLNGGYDAATDEPVNHYTLQLIQRFDTTPND